MHSSQVNFALEHHSNAGFIVFMTNIKALDKREYLVIIRDIIFLFCIKTYIVTPHLNRLNETD